MSLWNSSNKFLRLRFRNEIQFIFVVQLNNDLKLDRQILWKMPPSSIRKNIYIYWGTDQSFKTHSRIVTTSAPMKCKLDAILAEHWSVPRSFVKRFSLEEP